MSKDQRTGFVWWCACTILVSAFLLFQVQPMISKMILPWFGGSPAVWSTCMLFFQVLLLAGYAYSHWLAKLPRASSQATIHVVLLAAATLLLPVVPHESWKPTDSSHPTTTILLLLGRSVGLPYFLLSSTGPLVQAWFGRACPGRSPYRLYALSNVGSLGALLTYPFVFEPWLTTISQGWLWSAAFTVFAVLCAGLAIAVARDKRNVGAYERGLIEESERGESASPPGVRDHLTWLGLAALGSTALLTVTNHLCEDVAVVPFMWVAPLSLYLLSFILCFDSERWYSRRVFSFGAMAAILLICLFVLFNEVTPGMGQWTTRYLRWDLIKWLHKIGIANAGGEFGDNILWQAAAYLAGLFFICMLCHGELVWRKPAPRHLTAFYLMTSAGGAAGGVLVALVCPRVFRTNFELNLTMMISFALALSVFLIDGIQRLTAPFSGPCVTAGPAGRTLAWLADVLVTNRMSRPADAAALAADWRWWRWTQNFVTFAVLPVACYDVLFVAKAQISREVTTDIATTRNFYGVLHVKELNASDPDNLTFAGRQLVNGRIIHGFQFMSAEKRRTATTYYTESSGVGVAVTSFPRNFGRRIAVVGLGVGTMASYGEAGDYFRFYEINPQVVELAGTHFSYLRDCPAKVEVALGDARLSMEQEEPQHFDVMVLDAFSSDAIPVHLLTAEAFAIYLRHLKPDGVIAVHTSNKHLDLVPVVMGLAKFHELKLVLVENDQEAATEAEYTSDWLLVSREQAIIDGVTETIDLMKNLDPLSAPNYSPPTYHSDRMPLWTDQYSNLFTILKDAPTREDIRQFFQRKFSGKP